MLKRVYVPLNSEERKALITLAEIKQRDPRRQAAYLIRQSLEKSGLLKPVQTQILTVTNDVKPSLKPVTQMELNDVVCEDGGRLKELFKLEEFGQLALRIIPSGIETKGHKHPETDEWWAVVRGTGKVRMESLEGYKIEKIYTSDNIEILYMPAGVGHQIKNIGDGDLFLLFWTNTIYDPESIDKVEWEWSTS